MKKYFYSLFAAATMLLATASCSQDEPFEQVNGEKTLFTVALQGATGTRTIGDGTTATKLYYEVYHGDECIIDKEGVTINTTASVELPLLKGEKYDIIFWAQSENGIYEVDNLKEITVDYSNPKANMEDYDAFYNALNDFEATGKAHTIELRRPFAQLNLGTSDWEKAKEGLAAGGETDEAPVTVTQVTVKGLATTFHPLTGEADGDTSENGVIFAYNAIPAQEALTIDNVEYRYLSMNYLLVPSKKKPQELDAYQQATKDGEDKANVDITFALKRGETELFELEVPNAPVQRNWRTNVVGELLTGTSFNIEIKPELDGNYGSADALQETLSKGGEIELTYNVALEKALVIPEGVEVTLKLNGNSIEAPQSYAIINNGTLTIEGEGTISGLGCISTTGGELTINGGNYYGSSKYQENNYQQTLYAKNSKVTINGGNFDATVNGQSNAMIMVQAGTEMVINGGTFTNVEEGKLSNFDPYLFTYGDGGKLTINSGDFYGGWRFNMDADTDIYGGTFTLTTDGQSFNANNPHTLTVCGGTFRFGKDTTETFVLGCVAEGYKAQTKEDEEGIYYVVPEGTNEVITISSVVELAAFAANVNNGDNFSNKTVVLTADIDLNNQEWTPIGNCTSGKYFQGTFDGQGHTISNLFVDDSTNESKHAHAGLFGWVDAAKATVKNVKVDGATVKGSHWVGVIAGYFTGRIENCTVTNATVEAVNLNKDANGDKVGGIVGYLNEHSYLNGNTVSNSTIKGNRDIGGIAGSVAASTYEMKNNKVSNVAITYSTAKDYSSAGEIVSGRTGYVADETNTFENVTITALITSTENLAAAVEAGVKEITLADGEYTMPTSSLANKEITFLGSKNAIIKMGDGTDQNTSGASLTFDGMTIQWNDNTSSDANNYKGLKHSASVVYKNCDIKGLQFLYADNVKFENCNLSTENAEHCVWTYGTDEVSFTNCKFNYVDRAVNCYSDQAVQATEATFTNCTFTKKTASTKSVGEEITGAIETNSSIMTSLTLNINSCTVSQGLLWWVSKWDSKQGANTVVTVDGKQVFPVAFIGETAYPTFEAAYEAANNGDEIKLLGGEYNPENKGGKNLTISAKEGEKVTFKLYNDGEDGCDYTFGSAGTGVATYIFNNITFDTTGNTGNYKGYAYMGATYNNCNFVGAWSLNNGNTYTFNDCTFDFKNGYFWTWAANKATFEGCTFNGNSKTILAHGSASTAITIKNCNFAATEKGYTGSGDNTACVEIDPVGTNTYTITFEGTNTKTDSYAGWTRVKDGSTGHKITGVN